MKDKKRNRFADAIVVTCIAVSALLTAAVVYEYHRLDTVLTPSVLGLIFGFWGGELMILALRQTLGSDLPERITNKTSDKNGERI